MAASSAVVVAVLALTRHSRVPHVMSRSGQALGLDEVCQDTPNWTSGWTACRVEKHGDDPTLCTPTGWTCKAYEVKGLCANGKQKGFAMGPAMNWPERNCCACKGFHMRASCNNDTRGTCLFTQHCDGWRGAVSCIAGKCICDPGYCASRTGTCIPGARSAWMHRENRNETPPPPQCSKVTSGVCPMPWDRCHAYRGPTTCQGGKCVCMPGSCTDLAGMCFPDMGVFNAAVKPVQQAQPQFPGTQANVVTAWSLSGGGPRTMSAALGQYRALYHLGLIPKLDLITSVSGGSWSSSILQFAPMDLQTMLGGPTDPAALTLAALDSTPPPFGAVLTNRTSSIAWDLRQKMVPFRMLWVETVGTAFLEPFGLYDLNAYMAPDSESVANIVARNPQLKGARFLTPQPGRAKSLVMCSAMEAPDGYKASANNVVSFQAAADYTGVPFYPNNSGVHYDSAVLGVPTMSHVMVGGGLIESFAFGGPAPAKRKQQFGGDNVQLYAPASPFSLAKAVGFSSAAFAGMATQIGVTGNQVNPQESVWPVSSDVHPRPLKAMTYQIGDGGNLENTGLLAALQRKATKIAVMVNSDTPLSTSQNFCNLPPNTQVTKGMVTQQLALLFGYLKGATSAEFFTHDQVFSPSDFFPLLCEFQRLKALGKAQIVRRTLTVQANAWWGITGGNTVDIIFSNLDTASEFIDQLPQDTRNALTSGPIGGLTHFPNFKTCFNNPGDLTQYTARQINLLAALTEWSILQNAAIFRDLYS